jgi:hypothetical protein
VEVERDPLERDPGIDGEPGQRRDLAGTPTPIVSPKQTSSTPRSTRRTATSTAAPARRGPVYGQPKAVET